MENEYLKQINYDNTTLTILKDNPNFSIVNKASFLSRYSRTEKTALELVNEFTGDNSNKGNEFYDKVLLDYGDDSINEMGNIQLVIEGISEVALRELISKRVGASFIQKSSRYIKYDKFHTPQELLELGGDFYDRYIQLMNKLISFYNKVKDELNRYYTQKHPIVNLNFYDSINKKVVPYHLLSKGEDVRDASKLYFGAIKDKTLDIARYILPSSSLTNVAININGRCLEHFLHILYQSELLENRLLHKKLKTLLVPEIESFIKRAIFEKNTLFDNSYSKYLSVINNNNRENIELETKVAEISIEMYSQMQIPERPKETYYEACIVSDDNDIIFPDDLPVDDTDMRKEPYTQLISRPYLKYPIIRKSSIFNPIINNALTAAAIVYNHRHRFYLIQAFKESESGQFKEYEQKMNFNNGINIEKNEVPYKIPKVIDTSVITFDSIFDFFINNKNNQTNELIQLMTKHRKNRRHKLTRHFEFGMNLYEIHCSFGAFRDLQRHRPLTLIPEKYLTTANGYILPPIFEELDELFIEYRTLMADVLSLFMPLIMKSDLNYALGQYVTTFGHIIKSLFLINDRALSHLVELRSTPAGHDEYRYIAQYMSKLTYDTLGKFKYTDFNPTTLNRYDSYLEKLIKLRKNN